jgi:hypothetical protein
VPALAVAKSGSTLARLQLCEILVAPMRTSCV